MTTLTLSVPEEIKRRVEGFVEMKWQAVAREAFRQKIADLEFLREFKSESELTGKGALRLGGKADKALAKRYKLLSGGE